MTTVQIKKTPARSAITQFLSDSTSPVDIEQILGFLRAKNLNTNKVTVYRIMNFLYENEIVEKLEFGEGKFRFEIKKGDHHHLVCTNCGKVGDIEDKFMNEIEGEIKNKRGFLVKSHNLEFFGACKDCQK